MPLFSQSYLSHASEPLSLDQLQKLNEQSDAYNETHGLSGVLYYNDGLFFQTLEGEKSEVQSLIERIAKDPRHERITHLSAIDIDKRVFPLWTMKFLRTASQIATQARG